MSLENATYISQLSKEDPPGTDLVSQGDDHIRLIKKVLQKSFPVTIEAALIPDITDKEGHILAVTDDGSAIEWRTSQGDSNFFRYWKSANQTIQSTSGWDKVIFDISKEDVEGVWADSQWVVGVAGVYQIDAWARITEAAVPDHDIAIRLNGEVLKQLSYTDYNSGSTKFHSIQISSPVMCNAGDTIDIAAATESSLTLAGSSNALSGVTGYRIR